MYNIIEKCISDKGITHLIIQADGEDKVIKISFDTACKMAKEGSIRDYTYVEMRKFKWLKGINGQSLVNVPIRPNNKQIHLRIKEPVKHMNNSILGYVLLDENGNEVKVSKTKMWELAKEGLIEGVTAKVDKDQKIKIIDLGDNGGTANE